MRPVRIEDDGGLDAPYRAFMSGFPSGVAVITTMDASRRPCGMTCTALASVTVRPPTLLICVDVRSRTLTALLERGLFAVNLLHADGRSAAVTFASSDEDRFARVAWRPSADLGLPWLLDAAGAVAQCAVTGTRTVGDHVVVFGEVRSIWSLSVGAPLLYGLHRYGAWSSENAPIGGPPVHDTARGK